MGFSTIWTMIKTGIVLGSLLLHLANAKSERTCHFSSRSHVDGFCGSLIARSVGGSISMTWWRAWAPLPTT